MRELYQRYLNNLTECHNLVKKNLFTDASDQDSLLEMIRENSRRTHQLRLENDELLNTFLYSRKAETLTDRDVQELQELADSLYSFLYQNDIGVSYRVHQLLYDHATLHNDYDRIIRQSYLLGTNLYYLNVQMNELGINLFGERITKLFRYAAEQFPNYDQIADPETRGYIIRCLSNLWLSDASTSCRHDPGKCADIIECYKAFNNYFYLLIDLYSTLDYQSLPETFPRDQAIFNLHYNRCQFFHDLQYELPEEICCELLESAQYIYDHRHQFTQSNSVVQPGQIEYIYDMNRFRMGLMTRAEMLETLIAMVESADHNDFSVDGITRNLQLPIYMEYVYHAMSEDERRPYLAKLTFISQEANNYLLRAPHNEFSNVITRAVGESIRYRVQHGKQLHYQMFSALLFCHPPTYIHVHVVAALCQKLLMHMALVMPRKLIGLFGMTSPDEIRAKAQTLGERIYMCALYHDIGKLMILDCISIYSRKLLEEEFAAIKLHPTIGSLLLDQLEMPELSAVTLHHHRSFDERSGYPADCPPCPKEYKPLVDIITICDVIEAATDDIGRSYSAVQTFESIIDRLREKSGTLYSPDVLALFDDAAFTASVKSEMMSARKEAYLEIYGSSSLYCK